jgi:hypothetical protein
MILMKYIAKIEIGDYKVGEEVPADKALVWIQMFKESPVEEVQEQITKPEVVVKPLAKPKSRKK